MVNVNGELLFEENVSLSINNRAFLYGDSVFETIKVSNNRVVFMEDHYFRLMASMRMMRMKIPMSFTLEFLQEEIMKTVKLQDDSPQYRVRLSVFRDEGGYYTPEKNTISYLIKVSPLVNPVREEYKIDVFKDFYVYSGLLSTIKTNNKMLNTLASIFAKENELDNCVLVNEQKNVAEVTNGNIFIVKGNTIKTPPLTDGCLKGIVRKKMIDILTKHPDYKIEEASFSPFEIQKADEVFITNAIMGVQPVTQYKKKKFTPKVSLALANSLKVSEITG
ncbi:MAG: aminotransferase class IV [Flavobacteriaceae bacterium]|nr:aminotransferase class IV [Flavobacteriaceae bacterium]|tara:strand:- start:87493 stop:88323 length:831 start_codon:yes stop_codon:yes gene_type:complete